MLNASRTFLGQLLNALPNGNRDRIVFARRRIAPESVSGGEAAPAGAAEAR